MSDEPSGEPIDVVLSVGPLDRHVVALREFLHASSAVEVQGVVDRGGDDLPALITCSRLGPIEVVEGDRTVHMPHAVELEGDPPAFPPMAPLPPLEVDPEEGTVAGPLGGVEAAAHGVFALADALGGHSVAMAFWPTTDPELPLGIAARPGEPAVLTIGEEQFTLPE
jgi:hypothetical protein